VQKYAVLVLAQIAVGAAAIFARLALSGAAPLAVAASRLVVASIVLLTIGAITRSAAAAGASDRKLFVLAGFALALHFATWIWSLQYTSVAVSTLLVATTPIWTALYESLAYRRRLSLPAWLAFVAGAVGLVLVVGWNSTRPPVPGHELLGAALAVAGAVAIAAYFMIVRGMRASYGTRAIVTRTYSWAALMLVAAAAAARQTPPSISNTTAWGGIVAMALVSQLLGHTALNASLRWFSASAVAFTTLCEPIAAALLALLIFGEGLTPAALFGGCLVLAAIAVFLREEREIATAA
jgi:drug/metabolite transporter (DMT)-like permease